MGHAAMAAQLQHVDEAGQVAVDVGMRVFQRVTHAGLGGQVDDPGRLDLVEQRGQAVAVGQVEHADIGVRAQRGHAITLDLRSVVVVVVVQADDALAALTQGLAGVGADETGGTGHENRHGICPSCSHVSMQCVAGTPAWRSARPGGRPHQRLSGASLANVALRSLLKSHHGRGASPSMTRSTDRNTSITQGSCTTPVRGDADADQTQIFLTGRPDIRQVGQTQQMVAVDLGGVHWLGKIL